jgi:signal transduction histidine kinase
MPFGLPARIGSGTLGLSHAPRLGVLERIALLVIIVIVIGIDVFGIFVIPDVPLLSSLLSISTTAVFALYLRSPAIATILLGIVLTISFFVTDASVLLAAAVAAGLVMRLGRTALVLSYTAVFVVSAAIVGFDDATGTASIGVYLIMATVSGAVGFALRAAAERGRVLEHELAESAEQERQAVLAERRWIAGELHDSIAHHLTVVALHVQMLDDPKVSAQSQEAIRVAARKAMADLRFVIELADDGPRASGVPTGDLGEASDEARTEISAAGHEVVAEGDPLDERIPRIVDIVFARIVRESATNILKHAGAGVVAMRLQIDDEHATLSIRSPLPTTPRRDLPSSGTGLNRMAERVIGASGEFTAGPVDDAWEVSARLPMT